MAKLGNIMNMIAEAEAKLPPDDVKEIRSGFERFKDGERIVGGKDIEDMDLSEKTINCLQTMMREAEDYFSAKRGKLNA